MSDRDTLERVHRLVRAATGDKYGDGMLVTNVIVGYADPEYRNAYDNDVVVLGNWNPRNLSGDRTRKLYGPEANLTLAERVGPRLANALEKVGADVQWLDEWSECMECYRAVRTEPNSYSWQPQFAWIEDELICSECLREMLPDVLETYVNEPTKCVTWLSSGDMIEQGYQQVGDYYENGWHPGQTDDPNVILERVLRDNQDAQVVFLLNSTGQFDIRFTAWIKTTDDDPNYTQDDRPSTDDLEALPNLAVGQVADLKSDHNGVRFWLARTDTSDGEPFDNTVYVEVQYPDGSWVDHCYYDGDNVEDVHYTERGF